jgi:hypothetical protein
MKTFLKILAWVGLLLIVLGVLLSFSSSSTWITTGQLGSGVGFFVTFCVGSFGTLLALLGGLIARPKYFWVGAIIVGIVYLSSFYGYLADWEPRYLPGVIVMLLPGAICVGLGSVLFRKR